MTRMTDDRDIAFGEAMSEPAPVEVAHPLVIVGLVDSLQPWRADGVRWRLRYADEHEDIEALPVDEQVAILLAICASGDGPTDFRDVVSDRAGKLAANAYHALPRWIPESDEWAEAEARIRTGKARS